MSDPRIFVSIAAFCDPMLPFTIRSALEAAHRPGRLSFGIIEQADDTERAPLQPDAGRFAWLHLDPRQSRGACWARALAMTLYDGEDYFLQIDSHTYFEPGWDDAMVDTHDLICRRSRNERVILSSRPFAFDILPSGTVETRRFTANTLTLVPDTRVIDLADPAISFTSCDSRQRIDMPGIQVSAAFLFAAGMIVEDLPYDPYLYFHGEEQSFSVRAFTHGWDIWHPNRVPLFHLYKTRAPHEAPLHWDETFDAERQEKWYTLQQRSHRRLADLLTGRLRGVHGAGSTRSVTDYLARAGLTLADQSLAKVR
jgi:hypothetical protein